MSFSSLPVICEQTNCNKLNLKKGNQQYFCVKCDMQLCAVCIYEHKQNYSLTNLKCDNEICYGSRIENQ